MESAQQSSFQESTLQSTVTEPQSPSNSRKRGRNILFLVGGLFLLGAVGASGYYLGTQQSGKSSISSIIESSPTPTSQDSVACTMDAKLCPDGSSVGRVGTNCEFAACPSSGELKGEGIVYTDPNGLFRLNYPRGWYTYSQGGVPSENSYAVAFSSKPESEKGWRDLDPNDFAFFVQVSPNKQATYDGGWDVVQQFPIERWFVGNELSTSKETTRIVSLPMVGGIQGFEVEKVPVRGFEGEPYYTREIYVVVKDQIVKITPFTGGSKSAFESKEKMFLDTLATVNYL